MRAFGERGIIAGCRTWWELTKLRSKRRADRWERPASNWRPWAAAAPIAV
jgi:hypothetical protein